MAEPADSPGDYGGELIEGVAKARRKITRRDFVKWGVAAGAFAGLSSVGVLSALGILKGPQEAVPPWQVSPGVVDYDLVPTGLDGPTPSVLKVAQWFNYWPGKFLQDFEAYMATKGYNVKVQVSIFTSNEELFTWITLGRQKFDVFFPSNYVVDLMKNGHMVYNLNADWLPNFRSNVAYSGSPFVGVPQGNPFDLRVDEMPGGPEQHYVSVPYLWGTTGLGFRSDKLPRADVQANGMDFLWMDSFTPSDPRYASLQLTKRMRMLEDERDVLGWGLKKAGWETQKASGATPTGLMPPQWTTNETDPVRIQKAGDWLFQARNHLFDYNSTEAPTSLVSGAAVVNQVWSGDLMYAKRPDQNLSLPVDYLLPPQGSTWWIDCAAIHAKSRNLWLAHQFIDFIHSVNAPWQEHQLLVNYNLYSTANLPTYEYIQSHPFPNGYNMAEDPILYPNKLDPNWDKLDMSSDVGLDALASLYNPLWFELTSG